METNDTPPQKKAIKRRPWPEKHRRKLAKAALKNKAWEHATGPRTEGGKAKSAANARRHGLRSAEITKLRHLLRLQKTYIALCIRSITVLTSKTEELQNYGK